MSTSHLINTIAADKFQGNITVSQPEISMEKVRGLVDDWLAKQDRFWPQDLTHDVLLDGIECLYAAHWTLSGAASGNWSASIGVDRKVTEICRSYHGTGRLAGNNVFGRPSGAHCPTCNETGRIQKTVTDWHSQKSR